MSQKTDFILKLQKETINGAQAWDFESNIPSALSRNLNQYITSCYSTQLLGRTIYLYEYEFEMYSDDYDKHFTDLSYGIVVIENGFIFDRINSPYENEISTLFNIVRGTFTDNFYNLL